MRDIFGNPVGSDSGGPQYGKGGGVQDDRNVKNQQNIEHLIDAKIKANKEYLKPLYGSGEPLVPPRFIGDTYLDLTNRVLYCGYGIGLTDWVTPRAVTITGNLLLESGDYLLTEDGYRIILDL